MDPYYDQRLRDEVLYLHSLWHQGPPRRNPNPINPNNIPRHLPSNSTKFKKERKNPRGKRARKGKKRPPESDLPPVSDFEWPCLPPAEAAPVTSSGWPVLKLPSSSKPRLPSAEEKSRFLANQLQQKALKAAQAFFANNADSDEDDTMDEDGEDEDDAMDENRCEEYEFFLKVFMEDSEIRVYYEKNYESGQFCCLVCGGIGEKVGKRFKDCVALVQHSITIAKTKKKRAHRAYGQAICKVLGWDINRLPTSILSLGDPKSGDSKGHADDGGKEDSNVLSNNVDSVNVDNGETVPIMDSNAVSEALPDKVVELANGIDGELMVCENSLTLANASKTMEDPDNGVSNVAEGNAEGVVSCLQPLKDDGVGSCGNELKDNQKDNVVLDGLKEDDENQN